MNNEKRLISSLSSKINGKRSSYQYWQEFLSNQNRIRIMKVVVSICDYVRNLTFLNDSDS